MMPLFTALSIPTMSGLTQPTMNALAQPQMSGLTQPEMKPTDMFRPHPVPWHVGVRRPLQNMIARPLVTSHTVSLVTTSLVVALFSPTRVPSPTQSPEIARPTAGQLELPEIMGSHRSASLGSMLDVVSR